MENQNRAKAETHRKGEALPQLLDEFKPPKASDARWEQAASVAADADKQEAAQLLKEMQASAPPPAPLSPGQVSMNTERAAFAKGFAVKAEERNKIRPWWQKMFKRGEVTAEDMAQEDAEKTYVQISNFKSNPNMYRDGRSGPVYNSMASAEREGASESELSQVAAESDPNYSNRHNNPDLVERYAQLDAEHVAFERTQRSKQGLPTDILDADIMFKNAQESEQKERTEKKAA